VAGFSLRAGRAADKAVDVAKGGKAACKAAEQIHQHHLLPKAFKEYFEKAGLKIDDYTIPLPESLHTRRPHGVHTGVDNWNRQWKAFIEQNPNATQDEILGYMNQLRKDFGI
jgi:hypothetical protein